MYVIMPRIGCMYAGSSGSSHGCNKNSPGNGNGKWQGLAPITNMRSSLIPYTRARAGGENRDYVFCVNQLAGGVGKRSGQFVPGAGGGVKDCTPTNRIDPAVLESVEILQAFATTQGLVFALRGVQETINEDIDELSTLSFLPFDNYLVPEVLEEEYKLQANVRNAIKIINELKIELGVLSSADVQIHEATMVSQLDAIALADKGFGVEMQEVFGVWATPVKLYGTKYTEQLPIYAVFAGGYADKCSDVPKTFLAANPYVENPPRKVLGVVSDITSPIVPVPGNNLTDIVTPLQAFYAWFSSSNPSPFPWVNKNAKLGQASSAVMNMYRDFTNASATLTIAGTTIPLPTADSSTENSPVGWESDVADTTISDYRKIFDTSESTIMSGVLGYGYNKSSSTFSERVLGSNDDNTPDNVIVRRAFDYANGNNGVTAFNNLSGLANETLLVFNVLLGYKISKNDDGFWVTEKSQSSLSLIEALECKQGS